MGAKKDAIQKINQNTPLEVDTRKRDINELYYHELSQLYQYLTGEDTENMNGAEIKEKLSQLVTPEIAERREYTTDTRLWSEELQAIAEYLTQENPECLTCQKMEVTK